MEIPVINIDELNGKRRNETMLQLHEACAQWGFFWVENHGIRKELMEKVKELVNQHYKENLKEKFFDSELAKELESHSDSKIPDVDWESGFFIRHQPNPNFNDIPNLEVACKSRKMALTKSIPEPFQSIHGPQQSTTAELMYEFMNLGSFSPQSLGARFMDKDTKRQYGYSSKILKAENPSLLII